MFSIICCSIDKEAANRLKENIADTISAPFEFVAFDNREHGWGLCKVYNYCAERAKYDFLCFVHEDVLFLTHNWGEIIAAQLSKPDCGVIGFAGSILKLRQLSGWLNGGGDLRANYVQYMRNGDHLTIANPNKQLFSPVVSLDGMTLFVNRKVWKENRFDEQLLTGFHGYDLDFSLSVAQHYKNWVCNTVLIEHFSTGSFSEEWISTIKLLHKKWDSVLPMYAEPLTEQQIRHYKIWGEGQFIRFMWQKGCFYEKSFIDGCRFFVKHPFHRAAWILLPKYISYKFRYIRRNLKSK